MAGSYGGTMTVGELLEHGDLGLGTLDSIDGELIVLMARLIMFQRVRRPARNCGSVTRCPYSLRCSGTASGRGHFPPAL